MEQLSGMDYSLLEMESSRMPNLITTAIIYDQTEREGGPASFADIRRVFEGNLGNSAVFRRKVVKKRVGGDTPYWVEDKEFDLDNHLHHISLPEPGDWRQFCKQIARLHAKPLDMTKPLWEAYVVEGLDAIDDVAPGSFAVVYKFHHAAVDGVSVAMIINRLHGHDDAQLVEEVESDDWEGQEDPSIFDAWSRAVTNTIERNRKFSENMLAQTQKAMQAMAAGQFEMPKKSTAPKRTRFSEKISAQRTAGSLILQLDDVKAIRNGVPDATVNDVAVAVVGGAMRKYLESKGELPETSLVTGVPMNVRESLEGDLTGNQVGTMNVSMHTDIADPVERLQAVHASVVEAKARAEAQGPRTFVDFTEGFPPAAIGLGVKLMQQVAKRKSQSFPMHTMVSNVPGPNTPMYLGGARLNAIIGMGPLADGVGISHAIMSGGGKFPITFNACKQILTDPEFYEQCLKESWEELQQAATKLAKKGKKRK